MFEIPLILGYIWVNNMVKGVSMAVTNAVYDIVIKHHQISSLSNKYG